MNRNLFTSNLNVTMGKEKIWKEYINKEDNKERKPEIHRCVVEGTMNGHG